MLLCAAAAAASAAAPADTIAAFSNIIGRASPRSLEKQFPRTLANPFAAQLEAWKDDSRSGAKASVLNTVTLRVWGYLSSCTTEYSIHVVYVVLVMFHRGTSGG